MRVLKFGGTSVANAENIKKVVDILALKAEKQKVIAVVSAMGGVTDLLQQAGELAHAGDEAYLDVWDQLREKHLTAAQELHLNVSAIEHVKLGLKELKKILQGIYLINEFSNKSKDKVWGFGEVLSSFIISEYIKQRQENSTLTDSRELIVTNANFTKAVVHIEETYLRISDYFQNKSEQLFVMPGFVARNKKGVSTTLGRGGSDYTAALVAAALQADQLEIWTDVSGMFTANPSLVSEAYPIPTISYQEAMELSHFGAKVLYPPTIRPVLDKNIPILIKNTFEPEADGTRIQQDLSGDSSPVKGISHLPNISLITLEGTGMIGIPGFSKRLFESLSQERINVILITQASSEHSICIAVNDSEAQLAKTVLDAAFEFEISRKLLDPVYVESNLAIIAVIGDQMKSHQGISGKMFSSLGKNNVNIRAIAQGASERNISAVINSKDVKKALNTLHYRFFERQVKELNLFIVGVGNVGNRLLNQLKNQQSHLYDQLFMNVKVVGLCNSRKMVFDENGLDLSKWQQKLEDGQLKSAAAWMATIKELNLRNSVLVDITANQEIAVSYPDYLRESIAVIACNKIACSSSFDFYGKLKSLSRKYNAPFLFETNVGAGLPIIKTLNNLINSGDRILQIKAVLSGSLNFIFNHFDEHTPFHEVVQQAQDEGYTEPDPRIDLSGIDVARKILILARESGFQLDIEDIVNERFIPEAALEAESVTAFYEIMKQESAYFTNIYQEASKKGNKLKYVAEFSEGTAKVGLQEISPEDPFYNLDGKDNIVLFYTERYREQPLIIKGAGAGAEVTASGLFGDIISLGNK